MLRVDQHTTSGPAHNIWPRYHSSHLAETFQGPRSKEEQFPVLSGAKEEVNQILVKSLENEETLLDVSLGPDCLPVSSTPACTLSLLTNHSS